MNDKISKFPVGQVEKMIATDRENGVKELVTLIESGCKKYEEQTGVKLSRIL